MMEIDDRNRQRYVVDTQSKQTTGATMMETDGRARSALPPIGSLGTDGLQSEQSKQHQKYPSMSELNIAGSRLVNSSPTTQSGPSASYAYSASTGETASAPMASAYISPPESRRTTTEDSEPGGLRQSLPSIKEALLEKPMAYSAPTQPSTSPLEQQPSSTTAPLPTSQSRSFMGGPQGPPNPFAQTSVSTSSRSEQPYSPHPGYSQGHHRPETHVSSGFATVNNPDSGSRYTHPRSPRSATTSYPPASTRSPTLASSYLSNSGTSPTHYSSYRPGPLSNSTSNPPSSLGHADEKDRQYPPSWKYDGSQRYPPSAPHPQAHTESVKRHLDNYESEMAYNDIMESSTRILEFSKHFAQRAFQHQRSEFSLESLPSLPEIDDMLQQAHRMHSGLDRIRGSVIFQQQALADQRAYNNKVYEEEMNGYHDDSKGGFAGGDAKKRRGKAAPPGRCHSCNRAETPEWRRGPDGARTLCNACGLHYAKLTRKVGANKASALGGSNLRPKNMDLP